MKRTLVMAAMLLYGAYPLSAENIDVKPYLGENWYGLYFNGEKVGYLQKKIACEGDNAVVLIEDAHFMVSMSGAKQDMSIYSKRVYRLSGELLYIDAEMKDPAQTSSFHAEATGNELTMKSVLGGSIREEKFPLPSESLTDALRHALWAKSTPKPGDVITFSAFEPLYQKEVSGISRLVGSEQRIFNGVPTEVYEIHSVLDLMDIESTSYVTACGVTVEDVVAGVFTMRLEPEAAAKDVSYSVDTMVSNAVLIDPPIEKPRTREQLHLRLQGPIRETHLLNDVRQTMRIEDDSALFSAKQMDMSQLSIPRIPVTDEALGAYLASTAYIQSDEPRLREKAGEIVGTETDALKAATLLCNWVSANMRNVFSARLSNSLEALESLEGDCTEHSVLFVGLARAVGLPAKMAAGLIYVESGQPGFYFHQWASVWMGEWVDVDPAFNQVPVDVTHIKLAEGDLIRQAKVLPLIGRIRIEVLPDPSLEGASESDVPPAEQKKP